MKQAPNLEKPLEAIKTIAADLRDPNGGCPWDLKQTHQSMVKHLIEEAYETADALQKFNESQPESVENLKEELGDLFFQIVFHAQLASEKNLFDLNDIARTVAEKLIFRHPHVYGDLSDVDSPEKVLKNWEKLKRQEREKKARSENEPQSMLESIPDSMPALLKSFRIGQKVSRVGFDWADTPSGSAEIKKKIKEEIDEFTNELPPSPEELPEEQHNRVEEELGDFLFAVVQLARKYHLDPERALQKANNKFRRRFAFMENKLRDKLDANVIPSSDEWEQYWEQAKIETD